MAAKKNGKDHYGRGIYKAFHYTEHHPVLDAIDRVYELTGMLTASGSPHFAAIAEQSGVSDTTVRNWRSRKVKRPTDSAVEAVLRGCGAERVIQCRGQVIHYGAKLKRRSASVIDLSNRRRAVA